MLGNFTAKSTLFLLDFIGRSGNNLAVFGHFTVAAENTRLIRYFPDSATIWGVMR
jgi:hypothetical protein